MHPVEFVLKFTKVLQNGIRQLQPYTSKDIHDFGIQYEALTQALSGLSAWLAAYVSSSFVS